MEGLGLGLVDNVVRLELLEPCLHLGEAELDRIVLRGVGDIKDLLDLELVH